MSTCTLNGVINSFSAVFEAGVHRCRGPSVNPAVFAHVLYPGEKRMGRHRRGTAHWWSPIPKFINYPPCLADYMRECRMPLQLFCCCLTTKYFIRVLLMCIIYFFVLLYLHVNRNIFILFYLLIKVLMAHRCTYLCILYCMSLNKVL